MGFTVEHLRQAARLIAARAESAADELNTQDGALGDGDLGVTVSNGWRAVADGADELPEDLGRAFLEASKAFQRVSSSSFGTLTATALMAAAKATKGRSEADWSEVGGIMNSACQAMIARGKGALGEKSILDSIDAGAKAAEGLDAPDALLAAVDRAVDEAMDHFRDQPNKLGRARMFAEKSVGMDDPGMLAFRRIIDGLKG